MELLTMTGWTNGAARDAALADEPGHASTRAREAALAGDSVSGTISAERRAPSAERRAPSAERRAPSAERRAPSAEAMTASGACRATASGTDLPPDAPLPAERRDRSASRGRPPRLASRISTAARRLAAAGLLVLAGLAAGLTVSGEARAQGSITEVYSATMTVGSKFGGLISGYSTANGFGSISPSTFSYGGVSFTFSELIYASGNLTYSFSWTGNPTFASAYALCLDGNSARNGNANDIFGTSGIGQQVSLTDPSWTDGDKVDVKVVEGSTCPTPSLTPSKVTDTTATLTIGYHTDQWWHKRTSPTTGSRTCQGPVAMGTTTADLSSLTPGTSYTWKAYSATGCASGDELATAEFATRKAEVDTITHNTATLNVTNHPSTWYYKAGSGSCSTAQSGNSASLTGLMPNTAYTYKTYSNSTCTTLLATAAEFTTPEQTVTGFTLTVASSTSLTATWTAIPGYQHDVQWKTSGQDYDLQRTALAATSPYTKTGLTTGTAYTVRVRAWDVQNPTVYIYSPELTATPAVDTGPLDVVLQTTELAVCEDPDHESCPDDDVVAQGEEAQGSAGSSEAYTVRLNKQPTGDVTVKVLEHSPRLSVSPESLTFTTTNWNQNQQVVVTAVQDDIAWEEDGQIVKIRHLRSGGGRRTGISRHKVTATVYDDDTASVIVDANPGLSGDQTALTVAEDGSAKYTIRITSQPRGREYVQVKSSVWIGECWTGQRVFTRHRLAQVSGATFRTTSRFTADNWRALRYVTVHGVRDRIKNGGSRTAKICHETQAGSYYGKPVEDIDLTVTDADAAGISGDVNTLMPPGARMGWWIRVTGPAPKGNVTLEFRSSDQAVAKVDMDPGTPGDQNELTITPQNHRQNHLVRIRSIADGTATFTVHGAGATTLADAPIASDLANTVIGSVRVCTGANYKGGVGRCPDDPGYSRKPVEDDTPPPVHFLWPPLFGDTLNVDGPAQSATVGAPFSYTAPEATDENDGDTITYTAALSGGGALPGWLEFDAATRTFSGTPGAGDVTAAALAVVMTATDDGYSPLSGTWSFALSVSAAGNAEEGVPGDGAPEQANGAPAFGTEAQDGTAMVGAAFSYTAPEASDPDPGDTVTYAAALSGGNALPAWLAFNATTRTFSGTPGADDAPATLTVALTATDDGAPAGSASTSFTLRVQGTPPTAEAGTALTGKRGGDVTLAGSGTAHAQGSQALTYSWRIKAASHAELAAAKWLKNATSATATYGVPRRKDVTDRRAVDDGRTVDFELTVTDGDGETATDTVRMTIRGSTWNAVQASVADASAEESSGEIAFAVTLSAAARDAVSVDYATSNGTARAGSDYTAASGKLTFQPGQTSKTVTVTLLDDVHDEGTETFTLTLSNPTPAGTVTFKDATATGSISNADPLQRDWLARFGRAAASDAIAAVTARLETPRGAGSHFTVGGHRMPLDGSGAAEGQPNPPPAFTGGPDWLAWSDDPQAGKSRTMDTRELLMGTSFRAVLGGNGVAQFTSWGQGASVSHFSGAAPGLSFSGDAATGTLGMDYESGNLLAGLAMTHSLGEGTASGAGRSYAMGSTVTTALPYARLQVSERISAWGLAGAGSGQLSLDLDDGAAERYRADLTMTLAATGVRGEILTPAEAGGFALAVKADAFWVRTESDSVSMAGVGNLAAARADASRVRAVLDGSRTFALAGGGALTPSVELGVRQDGGDAETGTGMEFGAGIGYADPSRGLDMTLRVHGLAAHAEDDYDEWGVSGSLRLVPGAGGRGLTMSLTPSYGVDPGGSERLWMQPDPTGFAANDDAPLSSRFDAELGYGMALFDGGFTGTPNVGLGLSDTARELRLGWRMNAAAVGAGGFELNFDVTRREAANDDAPEHGVGARLTTRW